ncbi:MAG: hypothetical protein WC832_02565 [Anaerolineales bacterium]
MNFERSKYKQLQQFGFTYIRSTLWVQIFTQYPVSLGPGDEVLSTDHEYGALDRTWRFLAKERGYAYINQPIPVPLTTPQAFVAALWKGITPRTRNRNFPIQHHRDPP